MEVEPETCDMIAPLIQAIRLKTLPLAAGAMLMGATVAKSENAFDISILILSLSTAFLLQILSNLANDYGDYVNGIDGKDRTDRALSGGMISMRRMKIYLIINVVLVLISGIGLLMMAQNKSDISFWPMFILGILCILGAIFYTIGKKPYGYYALGDLSVLIFFGPVAVAGSFYLYTGTIHSLVILPSLVSGFVSAGVLNVNNIRDIDTDKAAGKRSLAMLLGDKNARRYHYALLLSAWGLWIGFNFNYAALAGILQSILGLLIILHLNGMYKAQIGNRKSFNDQLRNLSLTFLLASLLGFIFI